MVHYSLVPMPSHRPVLIAACKILYESNQKLDGLRYEARYVEHIMPFFLLYCTHVHHAGNFIIMQIAIKSFYKLCFWVSSIPNPNY